MEREKKVKCAFETAEQKQQRLEKQLESDRKRRERNATENDREGMLSRKRVCRRAKIENMTPQKNEKIAKHASKSKRKD